MSSSTMKPGKDKKDEAKTDPSELFVAIAKSADQIKQKINVYDVNVKTSIQYNIDKSPLHEAEQKLTTCIDDKVDNKSVIKTLYEHMDKQMHLLSGGKLEGDKKAYEAWKKEWDQGFEPAEKALKEKQVKIDELKSESQKLQKEIDELIKNDPKADVAGKTKEKVEKDAQVKDLQGKQKEGQDLLTSLKGGDAFNQNLTSLKRTAEGCALNANFQGHEAWLKKQGLKAEADRNVWVCIEGPQKGMRNLEGLMDAAGGINKVAEGIYQKQGSDLKIEVTKDGVRPLVPKHWWDDFLGDRLDIVQKYYAEVIDFLIGMQGAKRIVLDFKSANEVSLRMVDAAITEIQKRGAAVRLGPAIIEKIKQNGLYDKYFGEPNGLVVVANKNAEAKLGAEKHSSDVVEANTVDGMETIKKKMDTALGKLDAGTQSLEVAIDPGKKLDETQAQLANLQSAVKELNALNGLITSGAKGYDKLFEESAAKVSVHQEKLGKLVENSPDSPAIQEARKSCKTLGEDLVKVTHDHKEHQQNSKPQVTALKNK